MSAPPEPIAGLIRDHRLFEESVAAALRVAGTAAAAPGDAVLVPAAVAKLEGLKRLLESEVGIHIEKEEAVLFPVVQQQIDAARDVVDDMIAEHDHVRERRNQLRRTLAELDEQHSRVEGAVTRLVQGVAAAGVDAAALPALREQVVQLDWLLQGHFTGEEDGVFLPAEALLTPETLAELAERMAAIDARWQTGVTTMEVGDA